MTGKGQAGRVEIADLILRLRRANITDQRVVAALEAVPHK